jgi:hypothetical protein
MIDTPGRRRLVPTKWKKSPPQKIAKKLDGLGTGPKVWRSVKAYGGDLLLLKPVSQKRALADPDPFGEPTFHEKFSHQLHEWELA